MNSDSYKQRVCDVPERTGWTLLRRTVRANKMVSLLTAVKTASLDEKTWTIWLWKSIMFTQKNNPIIKDCVTETIVANFAPFPLPAPSSFATRTLQIVIKHSHVIIIDNLWLSYYIHTCYTKRKDENKLQINSINYKVHT